jgi:hypothetical protein
LLVAMVFPVGAQATDRRPAAAGLSALNPEIGVVGDVVGRLSEQQPEDPFGEDEGIDRFSFREAEVVFGAFVDPFMRADFAFVFSDGEDAKIEEAYLSFFSVPGRVRARVGKFRSKIGKMNLKDLNALPTVTEPLVIQEYLGEEGQSLTGVNVRRAFGLGPLTLEASGEVFEGGQDALFSGVRGEPILVAHLSGFVDFTSRANFELGLNYARGKHDVDALDPIVLRRAVLKGLDVTYRWRGLASRAVSVIGEAYRATRDRRAGDPELPDAEGGFLHADVRLAPRWSVGARHDKVEPLEQDPALPHDDRAGYAAYVTWHQSEFAHIRAQYQRTREPDGFGNDEFFLQFRAQIGVDRHGLQ